MHAAMIICVEERLAFRSNDFHGWGINFIPMESNSLGEVFPFIGKGDEWKFVIEFEKLRIFRNLENSSKEKIRTKNTN